MPLFRFPLVQCPPSLCCSSEQDLKAQELLELLNQAAGQDRHRNTLGLQEV